MSELTAGHAWSEGVWSSPATIAIGASGRMARDLGEGAAPSNPQASRIVLPGMHNLHSHAFQRAMAGRAERRSAAGGSDSFWTWREQMYAVAGRMDPDALRAVASQLYAEMLEAGYTSVCEFHYLHHDRDGRPYADPAAMSRAIIDAARETGIGLLLLPVLYMSGGFDGRPLADHQRRFGHDVDAYLRLLESLGPECDAQVALGIAFHSLRAVPEAAMREVLDATSGALLPVHVHIAEQVAEVEDCLAVRGRRPVRWLLDEMPVDGRWTLVHATHLDASEIAGIASAGATVALCPTTEGNLGDGLFPLPEFIAAGGHWGIGSDSHVSVSPVEELRWLEYGQRLTRLARNVSASAGLPSTGESLYAQALAGGERSSRRGAGRLQAGALADLVVLDGTHPQLAPCAPQGWIDGWLFSGNQPVVAETWVAGQQHVGSGGHRHRERYRREFAQALGRLRD